MRHVQSVGWGRIAVVSGILWSGLLGARASRAGEPPASAAAPDEAGAPALVKVDEYHAAGLFIDDPFALSDDGQSIAWITTDGATRAQLHFATVGKKGDAVELPYKSITPERVVFLDAERVLVVERNPTTHFARAEVYSRKGAAPGSFGPATDVGLGNVQGTPAIIAWLRAPGAKGNTHTFTAWRRDTLKPLGRKVMAENAGGKLPIAGSLYKPLYFLDGYALLVAQKEGEYDKKNDIRKPDLEGRVDVFSGKLVASREIKDVVAFTVTAQLRAKHPNEAAFVRFSDDLQRLQLIDADDVTTDLTPPHPLFRYDPQTLESHPTQPGGADTLDASLTVDPVNREAVKAQKADKDLLDVYRVDLKAKKLTQLARFDGQKRPTTWRLASGRLAVLRKHKGFGRGGADLEVYDVQGLRPVAAKAEPRATAAPTSKPEPKADAHSEVRETTADKAASKSADKAASKSADKAAAEKSPGKQQPPPAP